MGAIDQIKQVNEELASDPEVQDVSNKLDNSEQLYVFTTTPAGKAIVEGIYNDLVKVIVQLIAAARDPECKGVSPLCADLNAQLSLLARFKHSATDAERAAELLHALLKSKNR